MKQFRRIFSFELAYFFKNKVFVGVTLLLVGVIAVVMFFPRVSQAVGTKEDGGAGERPVMLVRASDPRTATRIKELFSAAFVDYTVELTDGSAKELETAILEEQAACGFVLTGDRGYTYYVNNRSIYDENTYLAEEALAEHYRANAMLNSGMTPEEVAAAMTVEIRGEVKNLGTDQAENYWYTYIMIFALYMVILLYGQMVATNVATEKSSRAMEVLITSAKPTAMMFGKVLASCVAGMVQLTAVFGSAILCYACNRAYWADNPVITSIFAMPPALLGYMLVFFVLGFLVYAFMFGAVGSTASKLEDINTAVMPVSLLFVAGFLVVMYSFGAGDMDNLAVKVCSFVPFTSSMAMFTRIAMSSVPWYEIALSIGILVGSVIGIGVIAAKIYRVGVLLYGTPPKITTLLKHIWLG